MKLNKIIIYSLLLGLLSLTNCNPSKSIANNYTSKTECIRMELDGSQSLIAWGNGSSKSNAIENAKRIALRDVLFQGITDGRSDCISIPIILEVNAQKTHETYFNNFFKNDSDYRKFISVKKEEKVTKVSADKNLTYRLEVRVLVAELKHKMIADGILKN